MHRRIYWDSFGLQSLHAGVGHHAFALHQALCARGVQPMVLPSLPQIDPAFRDHLAEGLRQPTHRYDRLKPLSLWRAGQQLKAIPKAHASLVHGLSNYNLPRTPTRGNWRRVLTVHDLIPWLAPQQVSMSLRLFLRWQMPRSLARADAIICVSRWTQDTLEEEFPAVRGRTVLIPNGLTPGLPLPETAGGESRLLTVSRFETYKRLPWIAALLRQLPASYSWDIVTDRAGQRQLATDFPDLAGRWRLHVGLSESALAALVAQAHLYVHPSLWEGYCLPAAQAIQAGKPVLYTRGSGIDETVGGAGWGIEREAGHAVWLDAIEAMRAQAVLWEGRCRIHGRLLPSWDEVAARTLAVYGMLME